MKYLIVGLGNIGREYCHTRHNIGFDMLDAFAEASNIVFESARYGDVGTGRLKGHTLILLKPSTYMNLSGMAVRYWLQKENIPLENLLVLVDDMSLPFGQFRLRGSGSPAGHNGLGNIEELLGTDAYARLRFGIDRDFHPGGQVDYVLGTWPEEQLKAMPQRLAVAVDIIKAFCLCGLQFAMNQYNRKGV